jgi:DNA-directed RNA polymerase subunit omega
MYALALMPNDMKQCGSRSRLVIVAAQRARQLMQGRPPAGASKHTKPTTIALEEVLNGGVKYVVGQEARDALRGERKLREQELARVHLMKVAAADALEIKKDLSVVVDDSRPQSPPLSLSSSYSDTSSSV